MEKSGLKYNEKSKNYEEKERAISHWLGSI
jgi:hypothetical protein